MTNPPRQTMIGVSMETRDMLKEECKAAYRTGLDRHWFSGKGVL